MSYTRYMDASINQYLKTMSKQLNQSVFRITDVAHKAFGESET